MHALRTYLVPVDIQVPYFTPCLPNFEYCKFLPRTGPLKTETRTTCKTRVGLSSDEVLKVNLQPRSSPWMTFVCVFMLDTTYNNYHSGLYSVEANNLFLKLSVSFYK